jgi:branched-chain amino acid aminotransferase
MELLSDIIVKRVYRSRVTETDFDNLEFGKYVSDHMFVCDYKNGEWQQPMIVPFANLSLSPATLALHYGQTVFEGMKAFRMQNGRVSIFRTAKHYERFARSLERMCMAVVPEDIFAEGLERLIDIDKSWVPRQEGSSLYLRPFMIATEARFGVKVSDEYRFIIFTGPVGPLYSRPVKVKVETDFIRAAKGGTGFAKCGGNYGGAFYPTQLARKEGYDNVIWTDAKEHRYIEESGVMNLVFVINDTLVTPPLSDSILDGVTRDSLLTLARGMGIKVEERPVSADELINAFLNRTITEAFGAGTAAVVLPIGLISIDGFDYQLPEYKDDNIMFVLKRKLEAIRSGKAEDVYNWNTIVG